MSSSWSGSPSTACILSQIYSCFSRHKSCLLLNLPVNLGPVASLATDYGWALEWEGIDGLPASGTADSNDVFHLLTPSSGAVGTSNQGSRITTVRKYNERIRSNSEDSYFSASFVWPRRYPKGTEAFKNPIAGQQTSAYEQSATD